MPAEELRTKFRAEQVLSEKISKEIASEEGSEKRRIAMEASDKNMIGEEGFRVLPRLRRLQLETGPARAAAGARGAGAIAPLQPQRDLPNTSLG